MHKAEGILKEVLAEAVIDLRGRMHLILLQQTKEYPARDTSRISHSRLTSHSRTISHSRPSSRSKSSGEEDMATWVQASFQWTPRKLEDRGRTMSEPEPQVDPPDRAPESIPVPLTPISETEELQTSQPAARSRSRSPRDNALISEDKEFREKVKESV